MHGAVPNEFTVDRVKHTFDNGDQRIKILKVDADAKCFRSDLSVFQI